MKYGTLKLEDKEWRLRAEPHVIQMAKRLWKRRGGSGTIALDATASIALDLVWFLQRFPVEMSDPDRAVLEGAAAGKRESIRRIGDYLGRHVAPPRFSLAVEPREYQAISAAIVLEQGHLLVADQVGLGKTCTAITAMADPRALPAVVVTMTHLPQQWEAQVRKFAPRLRTHLIRTGPLYPLEGAPTRRGQLPLPGQAPDVVIIPYSRLAKWSGVLALYARYVVFDEIQELRTGGGTAKYDGAKELAEGSEVAFRVGLSATPIYNYGDEIYPILSLLSPGCLGTREEFLGEWCTWAGNNKYKFTHPAAFGSWAREQGLMVRHTREQVARELPEVMVAVHEIGAEAKRLEEIEGRAAELARILLDSAKRERGEQLMAGGELDRLVRQATGLAKAPFVAEFVRLLVESGERVLLAGWHHAVYDLWEERLAGVKVGRYTGEESGTQKADAVHRFVSGQLDVLMISLRAGAGLDGLQHACRCVVYGELDWSPKVHEQVTGRLHRDGQQSPVLAYYLVADSGSDPIIAGVLGIKDQQSAGLLSPDQPGGETFAAADQDRTRRLAEAWLERNKERAA